MILCMSALLVQLLKTGKIVAELCSIIILFLPLNERPVNFNMCKFTQINLVSLINYFKMAISIDLIQTRKTTEIPCASEVT